MPGRERILNNVIGFQPPKVLRALLGVFVIHGVAAQSVLRGEPAASTHCARRIWRS